MLPPWSFSAWGDLPPEVAAAVFSRLLPRRGRWRWALYLSFGGEEETDGDFEAAAAVNLVCSSWHKSLGAAVTFLSPTFSSGATYKSLPGAELAARFPNLETLLAPGAEVGGGLAELQPLTALRELDLRCDDERLLLFV